jgi:adhesin transport system membrane fusion protein
LALATAVALLALAAAPAAAQTLPELLPDLLKTSKRMKAAEADMNAAREKAREALGDWFPKLDLTGNYGYERQYKGNNTADTSLPPREFEAKITQLLWDFGSNNRAIDNARLQFEQARAARDAAEQAAILEGVTAYLDLLRRTRILEFSRGSEDNVKRQTELEDARVQRGSGFSTDVLQSKRQLASAPAFPVDLAREDPVLIASALDSFRSRRARLESMLAQAREQVVQREQEIKEIGSRIETDRMALKYSREQIKISEELLKDDLTNRMLHLNLLKEEAVLRGRIEENTAARRRIEAALVEASARLDNVKRSSDTEIVEQLGDKRRSLDEFQSRQRKFTDSLERTVLRAPAEGVIKTMYIATVGGVVRAGGTVADLVPAGDVLVVEARLPVQDVGHVRGGQTATLKLASAEAVRFGNLEGKVVNVSPDALTTAQGATFYKVRIETERDYFQQRALRYDLVPGVRVACSILTGRRTVLKYLLDPLIGGADTALRER